MNRIGLLVVVLLSVTVLSGCQLNATQDVPAMSQAGRTIHEVQKTFDGNQGRLFAVYNRASRADLDIGDGRIVFHFVIAPDGFVTECSVVSSTYNKPAFEAQMVALIKSLDFGAKGAVAFDVSHYPITFHPRKFQAENAGTETGF